MQVPVSILGDVSCNSFLFKWLCFCLLLVKSQQTKYTRGRIPCFWGILQKISEKVGCAKWTSALVWRSHGINDHICWFELLASKSLWLMCSPGEGLLQSSSTSWEGEKEHQIPGGCLKAISELIWMVGNSPDASFLASFCFNLRKCWWRRLPQSRS